MYRISIIGAGNVAFRFALAFQAAGHTINCVCTRSFDKADKVVRALKKHRSDAKAVTDYSAIPESDILVIAVSDSAISSVAEAIKDYAGKFKLIVHTSGATDISILSDAGIDNCGVFYPLMTLSMNKDLDIKMVPFLLEARTNDGKEMLAELATTLKAEYNFYSSQKRLQMHTAAVFATNFINYMLSMAYDIAHPDFTFLLPSAIETVRKAFLHTPTKAQTGPALRRDMETLNKHIALLKERGLDEQARMYEILSGGIMEKYRKEKIKF